VKNKRKERVKKTTQLHLSMEVNETLKRVRDFADNPKAMTYFYELYISNYVGQPELDTTVPIIGTLCVQVPDELILAAGARPLRLCSGAAAYDQLGAEIMPARSCPLVKATFGMFQVDLDMLQKMKTVVIPTTCDQKRKAAEMLAASGADITVLEMPPHRDSILGRTFWQESIKQFALKLQKTTATKITSKSLQAAIAKVSKASRAYRELYNLQQSSPALLTGSNMLLVTNSYFFDDIDRWTIAVEELNHELNRRPAKGIHAGNSHAPRLLITGSPSIFPNLKIPLLVEESGGLIVADEFCSSSRLLYDVPFYDEPTLNDMIPAIADRYLKPCTCPCFVNNSARQRKLLEMSRTFNIDGVVYQSFSGCMPYEMEQKQVNTALSEADIPMLYLETDYSPEDSGQLSTRVEAFLEAIKARKRRRSKAA
jgi:benzoyl-CoA reductase/2-hydroxyglutaryl-CoA dehydratase subunit BcrC/BadD/HgdB